MSKDGNGKPPDDGPRKLEKTGAMRVLVSNALRLGVVASSSIVLLGIVLLLAKGTTGYGCDLRSLPCLLSGGSPMSSPYPTALISLLQGLLQLKTFAVIELGVVVLIATPVARVVTSMAAFAAERDRTFVVITLVVFLVLIFSLFVVPYIQVFKA